MPLSYSQFIVSYELYYCLHTKQIICKSLQMADLANSLGINFEILENIDLMSF